MPAGGGEQRPLVAPLLLLLVAEQPDHGYDLVERMAAFGIAAPETGHLYRLLRVLEEEGLVESAWRGSSGGPPRRRYEITAQGAAELERCSVRLAGLHDMLHAFQARVAELEAGDGPSPGRRSGPGGSGHGNGSAGGSASGSGGGSGGAGLGNGSAQRLGNGPGGAAAARPGSRRPPDPSR